MKKCWLCGYTDYSGLNFTTWLKHKVHTSCLQIHISNKTKTLELLKKIVELKES